MKRRPAGRADAAQVVVVGKTAGSVAAPVYGGLVADLLPDAQVTVFGAQSGAFPDDPGFNADILGEVWGAHDTMPDWEVNEGLTARDWVPPGSGSKPAFTIPTLCWPASTSPSTKTRRGSWRREAWIRRRWSS